MLFELSAPLAAAILFLGILFFLEAGCRLAMRQKSEGEVKGTGALEGAVFGLLGLLIAFTFSGAATRFEERRHLITQETNAIGTAWLRIDLIPVDAQPAVRALFVQYLENRTTAYRHASDREQHRVALEKTATLQQAIWNAAVQATGRPDARNQAMMLFLPALNEMIDITTTREIATFNHPPLVIFLMLGFLAWITAFLAGYSMSGSGHAIRTHRMMFALIISTTFFVILDLEFPRVGLIRIDDADRPLQELLQAFRKG